jgi:hypothetical protein
MPQGTDEITSWRALADLADACSDGSWIFRGEPRVGYTLRPKAGRFGTEPGSARKIPHDVTHEKKALDLFKRQARPYLAHTPSTDAEWLAIGQHHGMATRLLDWTESLLVAAYFAVEQAGVKGDARIYGVRNLRVATVAEEKKPFNLKAAAVYRPPHIAPRIPAQRSVFTLHPDPIEDFTAPELSLWTVSSIACGQIKRVLDACAITRAHFSLTSLGSLVTSGGAISGASCRSIVAAPNRGVSPGQAMEAFTCAGGTMIVCG